MENLIASVRHGVSHIGRFSGRDASNQFWPYVGLIIFLVFTGMGAVAIPPIFDTFERMQRFAAEHPELATIESGPGGYSISIRGNHPELMPDLASIIPSMLSIVGVAVLALAAAVSRRLHDGDRSALWGTLPLPFLAAGMVLMPNVVSSAASSSGPSLPLFFGLFFNNIFYLAALAWLVVLLAGKSTEGSNRFGADPRG